MKIRNNYAKGLSYNEIGRKYNLDSHIIGTVQKRQPEL